MCMQTNLKLHLTHPSGGFKVLFILKTVWMVYFIHIKTIIGELNIML